VTNAHTDLAPAWTASIPRHWCWMRNKELLFEAQTLSTDGSEELLSVSHLTGVGPRSEKNVTMTEAESLDGYRVVEQGDLVINTMWAWMGALGVARHAGIVSPAYGVYRPRPSAPFEPRFFDYLYRSTEYVIEMTRVSRGIWSSRLRIYPEVFLRMAVPVPPLEEQRAIADYLDRETARIDTLIEEQQRLIEMLRERRFALRTHVALHGTT
jgi:type I restriction enzyme, S subunit